MRRTQLLARSGGSFFGMANYNHAAAFCRTSSAQPLAIVLPRPGTRDERDLIGEALLNRVVSGSADDRAGARDEIDGGPMIDPQFRRTSRRAYRCDAAGAEQ